MADKLILEKMQNVSIEISNEDFKRLSSLAKETNMTENELINTFIEYGLKHSKLD